MEDPLSDMQEAVMLTWAVVIGFGIGVALALQLGAWWQRSGWIWLI